MAGKKILFLLKTTILMIGLFSCATIPKGVKAVSPFYKDKYLGLWYEIARIDFKFEKDLDNTTAEYSLTDKGYIQVVNKGFDTINHQWKQATGKAKFVGSDNIGMLKVSFFGPFYAGYNVLAVDSGYQYALVGGSDVKYLWILSRTTTLPENVKQQYLSLAKNFGYRTSELVWVKHN